MSKQFKFNVAEQTVFGNSGGTKTVLITLMNEVIVGTIEVNIPSDFEPFELGVYKVTFEKEKENETKS